MQEAWPFAVRSGEWPAWFSFWFSGRWQALAKGTAWAGFYSVILRLLLLLLLLLRWCTPIEQCGGGRNALEAPSTVRLLARDPRVLVGWPFPLSFGLTTLGALERARAVAAAAAAERESTAADAEAASAVAREAQTREAHLTARAEAAVAASVALEVDLEKTANDLEKTRGTLASTVARKLAVAKDTLLDAAGADEAHGDLRAVAIRRAKADVLAAEIDRMQTGVKQLTPPRKKRHSSEAPHPRTYE